MEAYQCQAVAEEPDLFLIRIRSSSLEMGKWQLYISIYLGSNHLLR